MPGTAAAGGVHQVLERLVPTWNQSGIGGTFSGVDVGAAFHIIPTARRGVTGELEPYASPLSAPIDIAYGGAHRLGHRHRYRPPPFRGDWQADLGGRARETSRRVPSSGEPFSNCTRPCPGSCSAASAHRPTAPSTFMRFRARLRPGLINDN